ncbi:YgaP-like transmembrane domain [Sulfuriferula sp.]|uniref:YgaP-like transmembrane domain n=1 Tax=Sulfuriferula sp. TaxID=2025307 RepID=UPI003520D8E4
MAARLRLWTLYALFSVGGILGWILMAGGAGIALSGVFGFCPMRAMAGRRLGKRERN